MTEEQDRRISLLVAMAIGLIAGFLIGSAFMAIKLSSLQYNQ